MSETKLIKNKLTINKKHKVKLALYGLFVLMLITLSLVLIFSSGKNDSKPDDYTVKNSVVIQNSNDYSYFIKDNTASNSSIGSKYDLSNNELINTDKFAVIIGVTPPSTATLQDDFTLQFPRYITDSSGEKYFVKEIDTTKVVDPTNSQLVSITPYFTIGNFSTNCFINMTDPNNTDSVQKEFYKHIKEIIVDDVVEYIEVGSFAGLGYVESITLPFIGTQRGNYYNKNDNMGKDGYKSNFLSIFGYGPYLNGVNLDANNTGGFFPSFDYEVSYYAGNGVDNGNLIEPASSSNGNNNYGTVTGTTIGGSNVSSQTTTVATLSPSPVTGVHFMAQASNAIFKNYLIWYSTDNKTDLTTFYCPYYLRSVHITDEICVASRAFTDMSLLENLEIEFCQDTNITNKYTTNALTVGNWAFFRNYSLKSITLPNNATTLSEGMFSSCHNLTDVALPETLGINGKIPESCFADCISLETIILPRDVKIIDKKAFLNCQSLSYIGSYSSVSTYAVTTNNFVTLPQSLETIGNQAFRGCTSITSFVIPENVQSIGELAFNGCSALKDITLPFIGSSRGSSGVDDGSGLFGYIFGYYGYSGDGVDLTGAGYTGLYQVKQNGYGYDSSVANDYNSKTKSYFIPKDLSSVTITSETKVAPGAFMNCANIKNITILSTAEIGQVDTMTIAEGALYGCSALTEINIPFVGYQDSISNGTLGHIFGQIDWAGVSLNVTIKVARHLADNTYWYVPANLKTVEINHQTTIQSNAFYKMHMIETLIIDDSTLVMDRSIFNGNTNLTSLTLPFVGYQRGQMVSDYYGIHKDTYTTDYCYLGVYQETYNVRNSLIWLFAPMGSYQQEITGFYENFSITTVWRYSSYVGRIPYALKNVTITNDTYLDTYAFRGFKSLESITINSTAYSENGTDNGLVYIESTCMYNCQNLINLTVPFVGCQYNSANKSSGHGYTMGWFFGSSSYTGAVKTRQGSVDYFIPKTLSRIYINSGESYVNQYAFQNMSNLSSIAFQGTINELGRYAFYNCKNLTTLNWAYENASYGSGQDIPASFKTIPDYCFYGCVSLGEMERFIPANVEKIGNHSFDSTNISYIPSYLHTTLTSIGNYAFNGCQQILTFDFGELVNLLSVGEGVLANCTQLHTVILDKFLTNWMFMNDQSLQNINLSSYYGTTGARSDIPMGLFYGCTTLGNAVTPSGSTTPIGFEFDNVDITEIGAYAFADCSSFTSFILPESVTKINSGAFQGCIRLEKMTINRNCLNLVKGTDSDGTDLIERKSGTSFKADCGIYYGCNDDFYLEVYYASGQGPWAAGTWEKNWNCYYPIYVVGGDTSTIFRYDYSEDVKGYLITGFNTDDYTFVTTSHTGYKQYLLNDTLIFPDEYNGMQVKGILEGAFDGYGDDYLANVDTFVLGLNYIELGADVLNTTDRTIYIYSQFTAAQAQKYSTAVTASGNFKPQYIGGNTNPNINVINNYYGTNYGAESKYASRAMVFYKDAWKWVGTTPKVLLSAIHFDLEFESYTYDLGNQIVPEFVSITPNETTIKYTNNEETEKNNEDIILKEFYNYNSVDNVYDKSTIVGLEKILITYSQNVNVGTASITFQSKLDNIYGKTVQYFKITQYELMLFNEANNSDLVTSMFGSDSVYSYSDLFWSYYYGLYDYTDTSYLDSSGNTQNMITRMTYHNMVWYNDQWTRGSQVLNLPEGYKMSGRLETSSKDVGQYSSDKVEGNGSLTGSGFVWKGNVYIYDTNGKNVASNFKLIITLYVEIIPYEIDSTNIRWDGEYNSITNRYEYKYNGYVLTPKPYVYDSTWGILDPQFTVSVVLSYSPCGNQGSHAIDPGDVGSMTITGCSSNFILDSSIVVAYFEIVNGQITIKIYNTKYKLDENHNYFYYDGSRTTNGLNSWTNTNDFTMEVNGISDISKIYGSFITKQDGNVYLDKGTYTSAEYLDGLVSGDKYFWWDTSNLVNGLPYEIYSTERYANGVDETNGYLDESTKYEITLDIACQILYSDFDWNISITDYPTYVDATGILQVGNVETRSIDDCVNVIDKNFSYSDINKIDPLKIVYGVDGYEHQLSAIIYNITNLSTVNITISKGSVTNTQFTFKEITDASATGYVELGVVIERYNYETVTKTIQFQLRQGLFNFTKLDKEYDREHTNVYSAFLNMPADFYTKYTQTYTWYKYKEGSWVNINNEMTLLGTRVGSGLYGQFGPVDIGTYKVHIQIVNPNPTTTTTYFEDCDKEIQFTITPRSLIIDVSQTPYGIDNKDYDGLPWSYNPVGESSSASVVANINNTPTVVQYGLSLNLLSGDQLTGNFYSYSSYPSKYSSTNGDFYSYGAWYISNSSYGDQTGNYVLVFKGDFTINQLEFDYDIGADNVFNGSDKDGVTYTYNYDGKYHYATVKVNKPTSNYTIYYSEDNHYNGLNEDVEWSLYPKFYSDVNDGGLYYKTYIMIVSKDNVYKTVYECVTIIIKGGQIQLTVIEQDFVYDEFEHSIIVETNPLYANVYFKEVGSNYDTANFDPTDLSGFSTVAPSHVAQGYYYILVLCTARNYISYYEVVTMHIGGKTGNIINLSILAYDGNYDREYHGFTISNSQEAFETLTIKVAVNDGKKNWFDFAINETGTNTGIYEADIYQSAGEYPILVLIKKPGFTPIFKELVVKIKPLKLEISADGYNGVYDGNYHTAILTLNGGSNDILYLNNQLISRWTQADIYDFILNDNLHYSYQTIINGVDHYIDLEVEYGIISGGSIVWTTSIRKYINVIDTPVDLYFRVSGQDFETFGDITTNGLQYVNIEITKNPSIDVQYEKYIEIQYLARPLEYDDLEVETKHDGVKTIVWRDKYKPNTTISPGNIINPPQDLGSYIVYIKWSDTLNCAPVSIEIEVKIVPRILTVTYDEEYEYTGLAVVPNVTIETGTVDTVQYGLKSYDENQNPVNYWFTYPSGTYPFNYYYFSLVDESLNPNYELPAACQGFLKYRIINRTVYVDYDGEMEYTSHTIELAQVYDGAYPIGVIDDLTVSNLLAEDTLEFKLETVSSMRGTYTITCRYYHDGNDWVLHPTTPGISSYFNVHLVNVYNTNTTNTNRYYEVLFNIKLKIVNPPLEVSFTTPEEIIFDGYYHSPTITITSAFPGVVNWQFWEGDDMTLPTDPDDIKTSFPSYRNAGAYTINFIVSSDNYEPFQGQMVLIIKKATLITQLDSYTAVYDAQKHQTTWHQLNSPLINLLSSEEPSIYYFSKEEVSALGCDIDDIYDFFEDNCNDFTNPLYSLYNDACRRMITYGLHDDFMLDAGEYYAILYCADDDDMQTNIKQVVQVNHCTIEKRTLWFDVTFVNGNSAPFVKSYTYDGKKKPNNGCLFIGNSVFDSAYNSTSSYNQAVDAGLISGHYFKDPSLSGYTFTTSSADARGDADNENNGDPYEYEGDFDFLNCTIYGGGDDVTKNYQPAFIPDNSNNYPVQITIKRAYITDFTVYDGDVMYNGKNIIPSYKLNYVGDGIGDIETLYIPCTDDTYTWNSVLYPTPITDCTDVGYYIVLVRVAQGKNYHAWQGKAGSITYGIDPDTGDPMVWEVAHVHCVPYQVKVDWEETDVDYDGNYHSAVPYIIDVFGNKIYLHYTLYDKDRYPVLDTALQPDRDAQMLNAGRYFVSADCEDYPTDGDGNNAITNPDNYSLFYSTVEFTINKRIIYLSYNESCTWLHTNWTHQFTEDDEENVVGFKEAFPNYNLELTVTTKSEYYGTFYNSDQFIIEAKVYDNSSYPLPNDRPGYTFDLNPIDGSYKRFYYSSGLNVDGGCFYVADNFEFLICDGNFLVNVIENGISHTAYDTETEFDNQYHYPNLTVKSQSGDKYIIQYKWGLWNEGISEFYDPTAFNDMAWTTVRPSFINVGVYKVVYRITLVEGVANALEGELFIKITQAEAYISVRNLDKVYDASPYSTSNISITGGFNGDFLTSGGTDNRFARLKYTFYDAGSTTPLTSAPTDVGQYEIEITSSADGNSVYYQNYTELTTINNKFSFEITPATLTFNISADVQVDDSTDVIYDTKDPSSSDLYKYINLSGQQQSDSYTITKNSKDIKIENTLEITGLQGSDRFRYRIESTITTLGIGTYSFTNAVSTTQGAYDYSTSSINKWYFYDNSIFYIDWSTFYLDGTSREVHNNENYLIKLVFTLQTHFPEIPMNTLPTEVYADYTGNPISFNQAFEAQELANTGDSGRSLLSYVKDTGLVTNNLCDLNYSNYSSNSSSDYTLTDISKTEVGTYIVYFKISCQGKTFNSVVLNYQDYLGSIKFIIRQLDRTKDASWSFDSTKLNKIYDANSYDSTSWNLFSSAVTFSPVDYPAYAALPVPWSISYYVAKEKNAGAGDWYASGNELTSVVDAGDYMFKLTIPENGIYAETVLVYYFKISRREYHVAYDGGNTYKTTYNTLTWQYDLVYNFAQHTSDFTVQRQGQVTDEGLIDNNNNGAVNHTLTKAVMISSNSVTGTYHQNQTETDVGYLNFRPSFHIIEDIDGNDVTSNYEFIFDYELEIEKGTIKLGTTIADGDTLKYDVDTFYVFEAWLVTPSGYSKGSHIEYSEDAQTWSSDPPASYNKAGTYTVYVRAKDVQYYNDIGPIAYTFTIAKLQNIITIDDPSKQYDGAEVNPQIHTLDYNGAAHQASSYYKSGVVIEYFEDNNGSVQLLGSRPITAGVYWVRVTIPDNDNYNGIQGVLKFEIFKRKLRVDDYNSVYTYNATNITPKYKVVYDNNGILFSSNNYSVLYYDSGVLIGTGTTPPKDVGASYSMVITPNDSANYEFVVSNSHGSTTPGNTYTLYYEIEKCTINISGIKSVNASNPGSTVTFTNSDLYITGVPSNVDDSQIEIVTNFVVNSNSLGTYAYQGDGLAAGFLTYFEYVTGISVPPLYKANVPENISNYNISVDITLNVGSDQLVYKIFNYDGIYDGQAHAAQFIYGGVDSASLGSTLFIMYSDKNTENIADYGSSPLQYTNYTNGMITLSVAIKSDTYTGGVWKFLHYDALDTELSKLYVRIEKANTKIENDNFDLSKVYDGQPVSHPTPSNNDFTIFTYAYDNLDACLSYTYEKWDGSNWILVNTNYGPIYAGKYRLKINIDCSKASNQQICPECINYNDYSTDWYEFTIEQRKLVIKIPDQVKKYDGYVWSAFLDSTFSAGSLNGVTFEQYLGATESGLVSGHTFTGYIETSTYLVDNYHGGHSVGLQAGDFVWHNQYEFKDSSGQTVPYANYDIYVEALVHIEKNVLDITFSGYGTFPHTGNPYYLTHNWNTYPFIGGATNYDDYIMYSYDPLGFDSSNTSWSINQTGTVIGQTAVFVRIDVPGYEVFEQQYIIEVVTLISNVTPSDWGLLGTPNNIVYNGIYYDNTQLKIKLQLSDQNDTRTPYLKYYYKNSNGDYVCYTDNLTSSLTYNQYAPYDEGGGGTHNLYPLNAGDYAVTFCVDAANGYSAYESALQYFTIKKREVSVEWWADYWKGTWPQMYYTGSVTNPVGHAYGVLQVSTNPITYEEIPLLYSPSASTYNLISKGYQVVVATIEPGKYPGNANSGIVGSEWHAAYEDNYILDNTKNCDYEIISGNPTPFPPPTPVPPGGKVLESIKFTEIQYDPQAQAANTPYVWSAALTIYFECTYTYSDNSTDVYYYQIDPIIPSDVGPMNLTINNVWDANWVLKLSNPTNLMFDLELQAQVTVPEFEVKAKLKNTQNYSWDINGDTNDQVIWVQLEPLQITDYTTEIELKNPTSNSLLLQYNGQTAIKTFYSQDGQNDPDQKTYVIIKTGFGGLQSDLTLEIHTPQATSTDPFEILYGRHAKASGSNRNELAYYIVKSSDSYPIQFEFGDYNLYKTYVDAHPSNSGADAYDLANYTNVDSSFVPAFTFTIKSPEPTYIQLTADSKINFVHYDQDLTVSSGTFGNLTYTFGVSNTDRYNNAGTTAADRKSSEYKLSHIDQMTTVDVLLNGNFVNNLKYLKVIDGLGNPLFDGSISITNMDLSYYVGTGSIIELYDDANHTTLLDAVEVVVVGDLNCDGAIDALDVAQSQTYNAFYDKITYQNNTSLITDIKSCKYLAGLIASGGTGNAFSDVNYTAILKSVTGGDTIENLFYSTIINHSNALH